MKLVKLTPKTDLGQNKLMKYGADWVVMDERRNMQDYTNEPGWFWYVRPVQNVQNRYGFGAFWVKRPGDKDYNIEVTKE